MLQDIEMYSLPSDCALEISGEYIQIQYFAFHKFYDFNII